MMPEEPTVINNVQYDNGTTSFSGETIPMLSESGYGGYGGANAVYKLNQNVFKDMFEEALGMKDFEHQNVMKIIGVSLSHDGFLSPEIILPLMDGGDLLKYVRNPNNKFDYKQVLIFSSPTKI